MIQNKIFVAFVVLLSSIVFGLHVKNEKIEDEVKDRLEKNQFNFLKLNVQGLFLQLVKLMILKIMKFQLKM